MATTYNIALVVTGQDRGASSMLGGLGSRFSSMLNIAGGILGADIFRRIGQGIWDMANYAFNAVGNMQKLEMSLQTLAAQELMSTGQITNMNDALAASAPLAEGLLKWVRDLSVTSPFEYQTVAQVLQYQKSFGATIETSKIATEGLLDYAAAVGLSNDQLDRLSYAFAQTSSSQKITMADIRQMSNSRFGVQQLNDVFAEMSKRTGVLVEDYTDFNAAIAAGKVTTEDFFISFGDYVKNNFEGSAKRMTRTLPGIVSNMKDVLFFGVSDLFGASGQVLADNLAPMLDTMIEWLDSGELQAIGANFAVGLQGFFDLVNQYAPIVIDFFTNLFSSLGGGQGLFDGVAVKANSLAGALMQVGVWVRQGLGIMAQFWEENGPTIITNATNVWNAIREGIDTLWAKIGPFVTETLSKIGDWFTENGPLIREYMTLMSNAFAAVIPVVVQAWDVIAPILGGIIDLVLGMSTLFMSLVTGDWAGAWDAFKGIVTNVIDAIDQALLGFLDMIATAFGSSWDELSTMWGNIWDMFVNILSAYIDNLIESISDWLTSIDESFATWSQGVGTWISGGLAAAWATITAWWDSVVIGFQSLTQRIGDWLRQGFQNLAAVFSLAFLVLLGLVFTFIDMLVAPFGTSSAQIVAFLRDAWDTIQEITANVLTGIIDFVVEAWASITTAFDEARAAVSERMTAIWNVISAIWMAIVSVVGTYLASLAAQSSAKMDEMRSAISSRLTSIKAVFTEAWNSVKTTLTAKFNEIKSTISSKVSEWVNAIRSKVGEFSAVGKSIVDGIKAGINNAWTSFLAWFTGIIRSLANKAMETLLSSSPSRVFTRIGGTIPQGLAKGITDNWSLPVRELSGLLGGMELAAQPAGAASYISNTDSSMKNYAPITIISNEGKTIEQLLRELRV